LAGICLAGVLVTASVALAIVLVGARVRLPTLNALELPPVELWSGWSYDGSCRLDVDAPVALLDTPLAIRATGLKPGQPLTLRLTTTDIRTHQLWQSFATFQADSEGTVDVPTARPLYGTYPKPDGMGLFWSMLPVGARDPQSMGLSVDKDGVSLEWTAEANGKTLAGTTLRRLIQTGITERDVREDGLIGRLFQPASAGRAPGIVMWGGSEGGFSDLVARLLASHGYATLALAYFRFESLPPELEEIPIEYFGKAIAWIKMQPGVRPDRIALRSGSRGTEAALLAAAVYSRDVRAVVATAPSAVAWQAASVGGYVGGRPAWTLNGKPVAFLQQAVTPGLLGTIIGIGGPFQHLTSYAPMLNDPSAAAAATIPVEKIGGPVLLITGSDDGRWPSARMAEMIIARLKANHHPYPDQHLQYPGAGHGIGVPYGPTVGVRNGVYALGGSMEANAAATSSSWSQTLAFLEEQLK
jgi:dienelactone hydrolase